MSFGATLPREFNITNQGVRLKFSNLTSNVGNAYNPLTGKFTSPVEGIYLFSWNIRSNFGTSVFTMLMVNRYGVMAMHTDSGESLHQGFQSSSSKTVIITLLKGDEVYIENVPQRGQILSDGRGQSGFVGTLLFSTFNPSINKFDHVSIFYFFCSCEL